jgi:D-serine deaminase-like pyridoxal phosphate-dependent protein
MKTLAQLETPALLLDGEALGRNLARMRKQIAELGVELRPHVKTAKSIDVVRLASGSHAAGITVSTLREAEYFFGHGLRNILYAVGIAPGKLPHVADLIRRGADLSVILDSVAAAESAIAAAVREQVRLPVLIELDVDGHRSGVGPESQLLLTLGKLLADSPNIEFRGVMTHAGGSYQCRSEQALRAMAETERAGAVRAAQRLRDSGVPVQVVSVGSTPTATFAQDLTGVTEVRAGVYMFHDLVMMGIGVCRMEDIALSVLVSVIGHQAERGWVITDGGWMALSRDRGTAAQPIDQAYGVVCDMGGRVLRDDLIVTSTNQEHGIVARRDGGLLDPADYPIGTKLRILPNHACATSAQHSHYEVVAPDGIHVSATWARIGGW